LPEPAAPGLARGTLVLVVGPSGAGKDSLIAYCRSRLDGVVPLSFPRRVITRAGGDGSENHQPISEDGFHRNAGEGAFALHWRAHGLGYGIPNAIVDDLAGGRHVVVNVSRSVVAEARQRFAPLLVVSVEAATEVLVERLHGRGREPMEDIPARLERADRHRVHGSDVVRIDNSGPLAEAGETLVNLLRSMPSHAPA
jgi:ribose 1,5-bisphosphokinase